MTAFAQIQQFIQGRNRNFQFLLLLGWIALGALLRFTNLALKPPSTIEIATLVFSLGNSLQTIPLNQIISLDTLLYPLQAQPGIHLNSIIHNLLTESTHPPVYFVLAGLWMKLFSPEQGMISWWMARSLPAVLGVATIPAIYSLVWIAFRSQLAAQFAAALMAVSPYGIFVAQEARHYTLAILLILASLCCLAIAVRTVTQRSLLPIWIGLLWVIINSLGVAVHYFFLLVLTAEAIVLLPVLWHTGPEKVGVSRKGRFSIFPKISTPQLRLFAVGIGTLIGCLVWLPELRDASDSEMTRWVYDGKSFIELLEPVPRLIAWLISMVALFPVEGVPISIIVISVIILLSFVCGLLPILIHTLKIELNQTETRLGIQVLGGFILASLAIFLGLTYGLGADLTLAARYQFVYFPAVIAIVATSLALCWTEQFQLSSETHPSLLTQVFTRLATKGQLKGKRIVVTVLLIGFVGSLTVVYNFGFQKSKRPDSLVPHIIQTQSATPDVPVLITMVRKSHSETRAMMAIAWEFKRVYSSSKIANSQQTQPNFLLATKEEDASEATRTLHQTLTQLPRPLDLWTIDFTAPVEPENQNCVLESRKQPKVAGYRYRLYHCS